MPEYEQHDSAADIQTTTAWLESFSFHVDLRPAYFVGTAAAMIFVTALTLVGQVVRAARSNPAVTLKNE